MRYDKKFYLCANEILVVRRKDGIHKGTTGTIHKVNPEMKNKLAEDIDSVVKVVEREWPDSDYCLVQALWDDGGWAVGAVIDCTDVERV